MTPEDQLLLICLRQDFTPEHVQAVVDQAYKVPLDWECIALTAEQHGVSGLIYRNLQLCQDDGLEIPEMAFQKLKLSSYRNAILKERQTERLIRALAYFKERNLEVMLVKGTALDICTYEKSDYILSEDIDIILHAKKENFSLETRKEIASYLHAQGIEYDYYSHHDIDINSILPIDFTSIWDQSVSMEYLGFFVKVMSSTDLLISLCISSNRKKYFRLKSLYDISETIRTHKDISWQRVAERARSFQCQNIVYTALLVASRVTNSELPLDWEKYFDIKPFKRSLINKTLSLMTNKISFYPYPFSNISIFGRPIHFSMVLPYIVYSGSQVGKKISFVSQNWDYTKTKFQP